jgi:hypothetical protein
MMLLRKLKASILERDLPQIPDGDEHRSFLVCFTLLEKLYLYGNVGEWRQTRTRLLPCGLVMNESQLNCPTTYKYFLDFS